MGVVEKTELSYLVVQIFKSNQTFCKWKPNQISRFGLMWSIFMVPLIPRDWKIGKYRRYFEEISDIGRHRNDNRHRLSIHRNIAKKSAKSSIYQWNIGEAPINRRKIASESYARSNRRYFYFSKVFPIFPTSPARVVVFFSLTQKSWI